jgi:hypothetical protein|nr:MAG TPA: hypothetical protein [Caudoviricetes sp.]
MELKLNIYNGKVIEKTYITDTYDLMYGTIEDVLNVIDLDKIDKSVELGKMIIRLLPLIKPFLKDVFDGLTDEELRRTKVKEVKQIFEKIFSYGFDLLIGVEDGSKN